MTGTRQLGVNRLKTLLLIAVIVVTGTSLAIGQVGLVDFDGTEIGLISYTNDALVGGGMSTNGNLASFEMFLLFASSGDAFNPMSRASLSPREADGDQVGMPFAVSDDSVAGATGNGVFAGDTQGFAGVTIEDGFFGISDNVNDSNPTGFNTADFVFDISGFTDLSMAIDFAAMGSFDVGVAADGQLDFFSVSYDIDGNGFTDAFLGDVAPLVNQTYFMDIGTQVDLLDPYRINGTILNDNFQTLVADIVGTGATLTVRVTASFDGGSEALGFDNLTIRGVPEPTSVSLLALAGLASLARRRRI